MNRFDFDHPMYVHTLAEPPTAGVPTPDELRRVYPASVDLATDAGREVVAAVAYPDVSWSISADTLDAMRRAGPDFRLFVEVGTFIGQGVLAVRDYFAAHGIDCPVLTVDTYAGTLLIALEAVEKRHGFIRYFERAAVAALFADRGHGNTTFPVHATARDFFRKFYYLGLRASHIYLDASHEYLDTFEELRLAWECVADGGVLAGDDYNWATVKVAVDRFCFEKRLAFSVHPGRARDGIAALQWVIAAKTGGPRHDDHLHDRRAVA